MADWQDLAQASIIALIFAFLLSKLISILHSFKSNRLKLLAPHRHQDDVIAPSDPLAESLFDDVDDGSDWEEGTEGSELEEVFAAATAFVAATAADRNAAKVSSDVQLQLYGFYKVATEGRCESPQPSAINITARAKWNAWKKLGDMSAEEAMDKYITIVTELYPSWLGSSTTKRSDDDASTSSAATKGAVGPVFSSFALNEESDNDLRLEPIHDLAREGKAEELLRLLGSGISIDLKDGEGRTPLHWAVDRGNIETVEVLLNKKANVNVKDNEGRTPLHYAVLCEREAIAELLVKGNADCNIKDEDGVSPVDLGGSRWTFLTTS